MFKGRFTKEGGFDFGEINRKRLYIFAKKNPGMPFEIKPILPESSKQRGFFEGSVCPLLTYYQEGMDHTNSKDVQNVREWLKTEFNAKAININGKIHKIGQSTSRKLSSGFLERVIGYIEENYAPPSEALNPAVYKDWRDRIFPYGGPDNFIDYLVEMKILTKPIENAVNSQDKREHLRTNEVFSLSETIKKLEDSERRDMNIIALYFEHRKPNLQNKEQYFQAVKRHLRAAKALVPFTDEQILKALDYAKKEYGEIYTLETLLKILTK